MKAKMRIIYCDGRLDWRKPDTFFIELRRWKCGLERDYVLELNFTTGEKIGIDYAGNETHEVKTQETLLNANSDGEAIRAAISRSELQFSKWREGGK